MTRTKRYSRRLIGAVIGLILGWWLAGVWSGQGGGINTLRAQDTGTTAHSDEAADHEGDHGAAGDHPQDAQDAQDGHDHEAYADPNFVPGEGQTDWYRGVLLTIGGLFVAAILIGIPAMKLRGPQAPEPAPSHDAHH